MVILCLALWGPSIHPIAVVPFCVPTNNTQTSHSWQPCSIIFGSSCLMIAILKEMKSSHPVSLFCIPWLVIFVVYLLGCFLPMWFVFLEKHLFYFFVHFFFFFFFLLCFWDRVLLYSFDCPGTHSVDEAGFKLRMLGLKACAMKHCSQTCARK